jgi:DNA polymerase elongation subunit (family B)
MKVTFSQSLIGSSALYESFVLYKLFQNGQNVRHGIVTEVGKDIEIAQLSNIPTPITKNNKIKPEKILKTEYSNIAFGYEGAYVKQSVAKIINTGTIIDLDAASLYPGMIRQYNIGFDTYRARIISPLAYKILQILEEHVGIKPIPNALSANLYQFVDDYIEREGSANKTKAKNQLYYILMYHIKVLLEKKIPLSKIYNPSNNIERCLLIHYLIPLVDIIDIIHPKHESYNDFVYDYLFDTKDNLKIKYPIIYLINNANSPSQYIEKLSVDNCLAKLENLIISINGPCYTKHSDHLGLFVNYLTEMAKLRKSYRKMASEFPRGSDRYYFYNDRQLAIKVLMNRCAI